MLPTLDFQPRAVCMRCRRPESVCYCRHVTAIDTATRVVLLQHPRERDVAIGTARMASLCLPNSELHVGVHWQGSSALARALGDPARPAALLYPGKSAVDVVKNPPTGPITLIVVDGTWSQARKLVRENPEIAALPRYAFVPPQPSEYRIRREPKETYVSTIEALVHVLGALEGDAGRFEALLAPFRAMVDAQLAHESSQHGARRRHAKAAEKRGKRANLPSMFRERCVDMVVGVGEANAWPHTTQERGRYPDELVHWVGCRLRTGEMFERIVAPRNPLAPKTVSHIGISGERLAAGCTTAELLRDWSAFLRPTDVFCSWGRYATALFVATGGELPETRLDLRQVARVFSRGKVGTLEEFVARCCGESPAHAAPGRAGRRAAEVRTVTQHFIDVASHAELGRAR